MINRLIESCLNSKTNPEKENFMRYPFRTIERINKIIPKKNNTNP